VKQDQEFKIEGSQGVEKDGQQTVKGLIRIQKGGWDWQWCNYGAAWVAKCPGPVGAYWGPQPQNLKHYKSTYLQNIIIFKMFIHYVFFI
jgi:hypothetical protein